MKIKLIALTAILDITYAAEEGEYTRWAEPMQELGYDWDAVSVTTEDGYDLTMFNVKGRNRIKAFL